jgi:2-oxo-3-hexenedioate decarboxylase
MAAVDIAAIAAEALSAIDAGRPIASRSTPHSAFTPADAYRAAAVMRDVRTARGERPLGRKIGFTNRTIWAEYGVYSPIWGTMFDTTVCDLAGLGPVSLSRFSEPRIEPEIVFGIGRAPEPGMDVAALIETVEWIAHGFEIVQSIYPGWTFTPAESVAANGLHGALFVGPRVAPGPDRASWLRVLERFDIDLMCDGKVVDRGNARNVLDGPLHALRHLVEMLASDPCNPPLAAGEIVTTGTLTRALPIKPGEVWSTELSGIALEGIAIRLC